MAATTTPSAAPTWRKTAIAIAWRALVAAALLAFIALHLDFVRVGAALRHMAPGFAIAAAGVMLLVGLLTAAKWYVLLRALSIRVPVVEVVRLTYIAVAWNLALPGGESGNLVKAGLLARQQPGAAGAVWASMLVDQLSLAVAQILVGVVTLLLAAHPPAHLGAWLSTSAILLAGILLFYALFLLPVRAGEVDVQIARLSRRLAVPQRWRRAETEGEWLLPLWRGLTRYRGHIGSIVAAVGLAMCYYGTIFLAYWLAARGLGLAFSYPDIAWILALAGIAALLPITVAGVGVREGIIVYFLKDRGVAPETALAFSFSVLALQVVLGLPGILAHFIHAPSRSHIPADVV
jgi:glycosyltransferase 2 family protein